MQRSLLSGIGLWCTTLGIFAQRKVPKPPCPMRPAFSSGHTSTSLVPEIPMVQPHTNPTESKDFRRVAMAGSPPACSSR